MNKWKRFNQMIGQNAELTGWEIAGLRRIFGILAVEDEGVGDKRVGAVVGPGRCRAYCQQQPKR
jgi:hypothetical protein